MFGVGVGVGALGGFQPGRRGRRTSKTPWARRGDQLVGGWVCPGVERTRLLPIGMEFRARGKPQRFKVASWPPKPSTTPVAALEISRGDSAVKVLGCRTQPVSARKQINKDEEQAAIIHERRIGGHPEALIEGDFA